jgi:hypothetical protein
VISVKYKVGIDCENINVRLSQHRSTTPAIKLEFLMYTDKNTLIETNMLERYKGKRKELNHEWIFNLDLSHLI